MSTVSSFMSDQPVPLDARVPATPDLTQRIRRLDWTEIAGDLDGFGCARTGRLLSPAECEALRAAYEYEDLYRSKVIMQRHNFGRGEYKYFAYPLPDVVQELRTLFYPPLAAIANRWHEKTGRSVRFPIEHEAFLKRCHDAGQSRPTPLVLRYGSGDYNCLHQDLYGEHAFPLQLTILLSDPQQDFTGGEFVLTEQRPRMQSRVEVVPLSQGEGVVFAVNERPVDGVRSTYRVRMRHGVSRVRDGWRYTLGIIFHDAA